ncbi:MAG: DNA/RNA nuclease SfsA [Bacillota bacterium]
MLEQVLVKCHTMGMSRDNNETDKTRKSANDQEGRLAGHFDANLCSEESRAVSISLGQLVEGRLIDRPNRFLAVVSLAGKTIQAHVPDPGRLKELLFSGNKVMVRNINTLNNTGNLQGRHNQPKSQMPRRKTQYDLVLAAFNDIWVCIDTRYPNRLFEQAVKEKALRDFKEYTSIHREVALNRLGEHLTQDDPEILARTLSKSAGNISSPENMRKTPKSRFDFLLQGPKKRPLLVEVKSVTLCIGGIGLFPDAPTQRGARHVRELKQVSSSGLDAMIVFIAQREDIMEVSAHKETDPKFADAIKEAANANVRILAYRCAVSPAHICLNPEPLPYR